MLLRTLGFPARSAVLQDTILASKMLFPPDESGSYKNNIIAQANELHSSSNQQIRRGAGAVSGDLDEKQQITISPMYYLVGGIFSILCFKVVFKP